MQNIVSGNTEGRKAKGRKREFTTKSTKNTKKRKKMISSLLSVLTVTLW
jgi:hypothetical protein